MELIEPRRGDSPDLSEHHDVRLSELRREDQSLADRDKKVVLVRCKGVRWYTDVEGAGSPALILKARVVTSSSRISEIPDFSYSL